MRLFTQLLLTLCFMIGFAVSNAQAAEKESTFDRVIKTNTIRCGYASWPPTLTKDPNSGEMSGYSYDVMNFIGKKLGMKIEWAEETGWGTAEQGIVAGRYDMMCSDVCLEPQRTRNTWFSTPIIYIPMFIFARTDDARFVADTGILNDPAMKVAVLPNTIFDFILQEQYPKAVRVDINDLANNVDMVSAVISKKADAGFNNLYSVEQFNKNNADAIKTIGDPVRYCQAAFLLPREDASFKHIIDSAISEMALTGKLREIYTKYSPDDGKHWQIPSSLNQPNASGKK